MAKKKEIIIDINTTRKGIEVAVSIPHYDPRSVPAMTFKTSDIARYLDKEGIKYGKPIKEDRLNNMPPDANLEGHWIFAKPGSPKKKKKTKRK